MGSETKMYAGEKRIIVANIKRKKVHIYFSFLFKGDTILIILRMQILHFLKGILHCFSIDIILQRKILYGCTLLPKKIAM